MAYKYAFNPISGEFDLVNPPQTGAIAMHVYTTAGAHVFVASGTSAIVWMRPGAGGGGGGGGGGSDNANNNAGAGGGGGSSGAGATTEWCPGIPLVPGNTYTATVGTGGVSGIGGTGMTFGGVPATAGGAGGAGSVSSLADTTLGLTLAQSWIPAGQLAGGFGGVAGTAGAGGGGAGGGQQNTCRGMRSSWYTNIGRPGGGTGLAGSTSNAVTYAASLTPLLGSQAIAFWATIGVNVWNQINGGAAGAGGGGGYGGGGGGGAGTGGQPGDEYQQTGQPVLSAIGTGIGGKGGDGAAIGGAPQDGANGGDGLAGTCGRGGSGGGGGGGAGRGVLMAGIHGGNGGNGGVGSAGMVLVIEYV